MTRSRLGSAAFLATTLLLGPPFASAQDSRPESAPAKLFNPAARWIWDGGDARPVDAYRLFGRRFELSARRGKVHIRITADSEYRLYVNGATAGQGPAPSPPGRATVDEIDISGMLHDGPNAIGIVVHHVGVPTFARVMGRAGLIAEINGIERGPIVTDGSWRTHDAWWVPTGEKLTPMREFTEHLDARKQAGAWDWPDFDDSAWKPATEIGPEGSSPWALLEMRDIPNPVRSELRPTRVIFTGRCPNEVPAKTEAAKALAGLPPGAQPAGESFDADGLLHFWGCTLDAREHGLFVGLDFGEEVSGSPRITADCEEDGAVVDIGYGEALDDGHVSVLRQGNPDCDRVTLRKGRQVLHIFHRRAFRFAVLAVRGGKVGLHFKMFEDRYPQASGKGQAHGFHCDDEKLERIWNTSVKTVSTCMNQTFMDCPWRERGQYVGDVLVEARSARYALGDTSLARRFLRQAAFCQPKDGLLDPAYPCDWEPWHGARAPNRIPGYGALWVVLLQEHFRATGDLELVRGLLDVMDRQLAWFERFRDPNGLITSAPEWNFIDWADLKPTSGLACLNLQYLMALQAAASIDASLGRASTRAAEAKRVASAFHALAWDEARGLYNDDKGVYTAHTNALALLALVEDLKIATRIIDQLRAPDVLQPASPYFEAFVLRALAKHGRHEDALRTIREKWGSMLDAHATTFWEAFDSRASLCHGWSSEPASFLIDEVLGLSYDARSQTVRFAPHPCDLKEASGGAWFVCGHASASFRIDVGGIHFTRQVLSARVESPHIPIELDLPAADDSPLTIDGQLIGARPSGGRIRTRLAPKDESYEVKVILP